MSSHTALPQLARRVLLELNRVRRKGRLEPLRTDARLARAAGRHCTEMLDDGYFGHGSAGGAPLSVRLVAYEAASARGWAVGETLFWSARTVAARQVVAGWLASPEHRAILLQARWRQVGVAAVHAESAPGFYGGRAVTVVTADFGVR